MKTRAKNRFLLPGLIAGLGLMLARGGSAQTFKVLYSFPPAFNNSDGPYINSAGANPLSSLTISGNTLYGTAYQGGKSGYGTIYAVNTDGTGFTNLHSFTGGNGGEAPIGGLILSGNSLYGTTIDGGSSSDGIVFAVNTNGTAFTNLHSFDGSDGYGPYDGTLVLLGDTLCGTTFSGGNPGPGTVFAVNTDGSDFTNLYNFAGNSDGGFPYGGLILSGNTFYGTTENSGSNGTGTIFAINTDGTGFASLYSFPTELPGYTNSDGIQPESSLVISGNRLYGTAYKGGPVNNGTVFAINTDGTGFTNLHSFGPPNCGNPFGINTNLDGAYPFASLLLSGRKLYGATEQGGSSGAGTIFALNTDGTGFTNLHVFTGGDGSAPEGALILSGNVLYGTASGEGYGRNGAYGEVFSITLPAPQLAIIPSGTNVILTWPTNVAGFDYTGYTLQATTNLVSPSWSAVSPSPVVVNGLETVTHAISGTQMFYRLMQ